MILVITYGFNSPKSSFFNPTCPRNIFHILHRQGPSYKDRTRTHLLIWIWKHWKIQIFLFHWVLYPIFLDLDGTPIQYHGRQNLRFCSSINYYYEGYKDSFKSKKFIISGAILFLPSNISVGRTSIFLWGIKTELSFFNRSWNEDDLSPYVILNALSCKEFILLLRSLLWNIQTYEQYLNWDVTKAFTTGFYFSRHMGRDFFYPSIFFWQLKI